MTIQVVPTIEELYQENGDRPLGLKVVFRGEEIPDTILIESTTMGYQYMVLLKNYVTIFSRTHVNPDKVNRVNLSKSNFISLAGLLRP